MRRRAVIVVNLRQTRCNAQRYSATIFPSSLALVTTENLETSARIDGFSTTLSSFKQTRFFLKTLKASPGSRIILKLRQFASEVVVYGLLWPFRHVSSFAETFPGSGSWPRNIGCYCHTMLEREFRIENKSRMEGRNVGSAHWAADCRVRFRSD